MFAYVRDFLYHHRRKFYFSGALLGGLTLLGKVAQHKLLSWQEQHAQQLLLQQKRKQHYERTLNTTHVTLLKLLPNICKVLDRELDSNILLQAIKDQPHLKRQLWHQLKMVGFGRSVCTVVCGALVAPTVHVVMMILAANTLDNDVLDGDKEQQRSLSVEVQAKYLSCLQNLIEEQLPDLVSRIMHITTNSLSTLPLDRQLTLPQLESILEQIVLSITNNKDTSSGVDNTATILPWSKYVKESECCLSHPEYTQQLHNMHLITVDILNTDDFNEVVNTLVQVGLNYVLDEMAAYYFSSQQSDEQSVIAHPVDSKSDEQHQEFFEIKHSNGSMEKLDSESNTIKACVTDNVKSAVCFDQKQTVCCDESESNAEENVREQLAGNLPEDCAPTVLPVSTTLEQEKTAPAAVTCRVVKLVPLLTRLPHLAFPRLGQTETEYYGRLLLCTQLEALAYNIYDMLMLTTK